MTTLRLLKTSFTAGEVAPPLLGRSDLAAYENGASKLRNVFIHPTGGVTRRAGLRHVGRARRLLERNERSLARVADPRQRRARAYALLARNGFDPDVCREVAAEVVAPETR